MWDGIAPRYLPPHIGDLDDNNTTTGRPTDDASIALQ
jgi:hypothetical protein